MKNIYLLLFSVIVITFLVPACKEEDDDPITSDPRSNIIGQWKCDEVSNVFGAQQYVIDISKEPNDSTKVIIDNFYNLGFGKEVFATVNNTTLTISSQLIEGQTVAGNGSISSNYKSITLTYSANDGSGEIDDVSATYTKQ